MPEDKTRKRLTLDKRIKKFFGGKKKNGSKKASRRATPPGTTAEGTSGPSGSTAPTRTLARARRGGQGGAPPVRQWQRGQAPNGPKGKPQAGNARGPKLVGAGKQGVAPTPLERGPSTGGLVSGGKQGVAPTPLDQGPSTGGLVSGGKQGVAPTPLDQGPSTTVAPEDQMPGTNYVTEDQGANYVTEFDESGANYVTGDESDDGNYTVAGDGLCNYQVAFDDGEGGDYIDSNNLISTSSSVEELDHAEQARKDLEARELRQAKIQFLQRRKMAEWFARHPSARPVAKPAPKTEEPGKGGADAGEHQYTSVDAGDSNDSAAEQNDSNYSMANYSMANYSMVDDDAEQEKRGTVSVSSSAEESDYDGVPKTGEMSYNSGELAAIKTKDLAFEVQGKYEPDMDRDALGKQLLQALLRKNSAHLKDADEIYKKGTKDEGRVAVERDEKSKNEKQAGGWATVALRTKHLDTDRSGRLMNPAKPSDGAWEVQYYFDQTQDLTNFLAKRLGASQHDTRDNFVIQYVGGKWLHADKKLVDTSDGETSAQQVNERLGHLRKKLQGIKDGTDKKALEMRLGHLTARFVRLRQKIKNVNSDPKVGGNYIYVMNAAGELFIGKGKAGIMHHSSFLAGGAVAAAGEIGISGGTIKHISNLSGHYRPGPVYLWQAVKQIQMLGAPMDFMVECAGVTRRMPALEFLHAMSPEVEPKWFDGGWAVEQLNLLQAPSKVA